jgi:NTE family protein
MPNVATPHRTALVLTGGGARAAFQVGVMKAVQRLNPMPQVNPFDIICGTSAGAVNAAALASYARNPELGIKHLERIWRNFHCHQIYYSDFINITRWFNRFLMNALFGYKATEPASMLNNKPLRHLLKRVILIDNIQKAIDAGDLFALAITCSSYATGESISFYQGHYSIKNWERHRRVGRRAQLNIEHMMASAAIPGIFPAISINNEYFGDGSVRQIAPISPALHMGADRVLVVGISGLAHERPESHPVAQMPYPSTAHIFNHLLNSAFLDSIETDVERLQRINKTVSHFTEQERIERGVNLKPVELLEIVPSKSLDDIAWEHANELPKTLRHFFRRNGTNEQGGSGILSYLLFEPGHCRALIKQGYEDAMKKKSQIISFLQQGTTHHEI